MRAERAATDDGVRLRYEANAPRRPVLMGIAIAIFCMFAPATAQAITPTIVNTSSTGGQTNWLETFTTAGETGNSANQVRVSVLVKHDPGREVTGLKFDDNYDGTDNTTADVVRAVTAQQPTIDGGYDYSRVTYQYAVPTANTGIDCGFLSGTRESTRPIRIRAVLDNNVETPTSSSNINFTAAGQCTGPEDYPYIYQRSQTASSITPGTSVTFTYRGDDPDTGVTGNRDFGGIRWRMRRQSDGATTTPQTSCPGNGDNVDKTLTVNFPDRGRWVVEAELLTNNDCANNDNAGSWWLIGAVDVNSPASSSPNVSLNIPRPQLNGNVTVTATVDDVSDASEGGVAQDLEWDLDENTGNGVNGFEDASLGDVATGLTLAQRTRTFNTTGLSPGIHTVRARVGDNGALGGADSIRRTKIATGTFLVDAPPTAFAQSLAAEAGKAKSITLTGTDPDGDTLTFSITDAPDHGTLTGTGASRTYTPAADYAGPDSFVYQVSDGFGGTDTETISIQVAPDTNITSGPTGITTSADPSFEFSSPTAGAAFECRLDEGIFTACTSPQAYTGLTDGEHTFRVRAIAAGNTDPTPASRTFTVEAAAPETTIDSGPSGAISDDTPTFTFSSNEVGSTFECRVDTGPFELCTSPETTDSLADGSHTFEVRAIDQAGKVDPTPASRSFTIGPSTTIDSGPTGATGDSTPTFTFSSGDSGATFECRVDGLTFAVCSSPFTTSLLTEGSHVFEVRAVDSNSNPDPTPASRSFTVDTADPETTIDSGPSGTTGTDTPTFTFSSTEGGTFECRIDGGTFTLCTSPETTDPLSEGPHTFEVRALDNAANPDPTPASRDFIVDTTDPQTTIDSGPTGTTNDSTATFTFSSDEPGATFECSVDGATFTICTSPFEAAPLADGPHSFEVRSTDAAANPDGTAASRSFTVDTSAPDTTILTGPSGTISTSSATFTFSSAELGARFECRLDAGDWVECESPYTLADLTDGNHTFEVRALDAAGNADATPDARAFTVDGTGPQTTIDSGPSGTVSSDSAEFTFSSDDSAATFECRIDSGTFSLCTSPQPYSGLSQGQHTFRVRAIDGSGNADSTPAARTWIVDTVAPTVSIDAGPGALTSSASPTFEFSSTDDDATFECRLDSTAPGDFTACTSPRNLSGLTEGPHTFEVRAVDPSDNTGTAASRTFTVDTTAPETTIDSAPPATTSSSSVQVSFSSSQPAGGTFTCSLDGEPFSSCDSPKTLSGLDEGAHTFQVRATDQAGNPDATPAETSWTVTGSDAPQTSITSGPSGTQASRGASFEFSASSAGATFECSLDGAAFAACTSPQSYTGLALGEHTFRVRAVHASGTDASPASRTFTIVEGSGGSGGDTPPQITPVKGKVKLPKSGKIVVAQVRCFAAPCTMTRAVAKLKAGKKQKVKVKAPTQIAADSTVAVTVKLPRSARTAVAAKGTGKLKVLLTASNGTGSTDATIKLKIKAKKK